MSRLWLSVQLEMVIRQTKPLVLRGVCVSTFFCLFNLVLQFKMEKKTFYRLRNLMKICVVFASFSG